MFLIPLWPGGMVAQLPGLASGHSHRSFAQWALLSMGMSRGTATAIGHRDSGPLRPSTAPVKVNIPYATPSQAILVLLSLARTTLPPKPCPCPRFCARQACPTKYSHTGPLGPGAVGSTGYHLPNSPLRRGCHSSRDHTSHAHRCTCACVYACVWACILKSHLGSSLSRGSSAEDSRGDGRAVRGWRRRGWGPWGKVDSPTLAPRPSLGCDPV